MYNEQILFVEYLKLKILKTENYEYEGRSGTVTELSRSKMTIRHLI